MPWVNAVFVAGAIGGMAPELARLLVRAQTGEFAKWLARLQNETLFSVAVPIIVGAGILILLALIGGLVAYYVREIHIGKAFLLGIGAPAFLLSTTGAVPKLKENTKETEIKITQAASELFGALSVIITTAQAQNIVKPHQSVVTLDLTGIATACDGCRLTFQDSQGEVLKSESLDQKDSIIRLAVPPAAKTALIEGVEATNDARFSLDQVYDAQAQAGQATIEVSRDRNYLNDVRYILGNDVIEPFDIQLQSQIRATD